MIIRKVGNRTYLTNLLGYTGKLVEYENGKVHLTVYSPSGTVILDRLYNNRRKAILAWNRVDSIKEK